MDANQVEELRARAKRLGILNYQTLNAEELELAVAERRRGADPHQAETKAREHRAEDES